MVDEGGAFLHLTVCHEEVGFVVRLSIHVGPRHGRDQDEDLGLQVEVLRDGAFLLQFVLHLSKTRTKTIL